MCSDGSYLPEELCPIVLAEGVDDSDKGPGKAHSYAYKVALGQLLSVPTEEDNEATHWEPAPPIEHADPTYIADVVTRYGTLDPDKQTAVATWLADADPAQPPAVTAKDLGRLSRELVAQLGALINRGIESEGAEPFDVEPTTSSDEAAANAEPSEVVAG